MCIRDSDNLLVQPDDHYSVCHSREGDAQLCFRICECQLRFLTLGNVSDDCQKCRGLSRSIFNQRDIRFYVNTCSTFPEHFVDGTDVSFLHKLRYRFEDLRTSPRSEEIRKRLSYHFFLGSLGDAQYSLIAIGHLPVQPAGHYSVHHGRNGGAQLCFRICECQLRFLALSNVTTYFENSGDSALLVLQQGPAARDRYRNTIARNVDQLPFPKSALQQLRPQCFARFREPCAQQRVRVLTFCLLLCPPIQTLGATVPVRNGPFWVQGQDGVVRRIKHRR